VSRSASVLLAGAILLTGCTAEVAGTGSASGAAPACAGAAVRADDVDLASALPSTGPSAVAVDPARNGPVTLDALLAYQPGEQNKAALRSGLTAAGFRDAYQRAWTGGAAGSGDYRAQLLIVYHFATADGACRFLAGEAARLTMTPKQVAGVPGAVGKSDRGAFWSATAEGSKGTYVIEASALSFVSPVDTWSTDLLRGTYAAL